MNSTIETLLALVEKDPLPARHASSYWQHYGREKIFERQGDELLLRADWFEWIKPMGWGSRMLRAWERWSYRPVTGRFKSFPEIWPVAVKLVRDLGGHPNFNALKNACTVALLTDHWRSHRLTPKTFAVIGDGFGFLSALIRRWVPDSRVYLIDLPKMLVLQARTHEMTQGDVRMECINGSDWKKEAALFFVPPDEIERIEEPIDGAVNMSSMQEMNPGSIAAYFAFLRRRSGPGSRFYCVNRAEKQLPDGQWIRFEEFPWRPEDQIFMDGDCPFYSHFMASFTLPKGPRVLGWRVPFVNYFDGIHRQRLVRLAP